MHLTRHRNRQGNGSGELAPLGRLRGEMDSLIDRFFRDPWGSLGAPWGGREGAITPRLDVAETDDGIALRMELPGVKAHDIDIEVTEGVLTVRGEKSDQKEEQGREYSYRESEYGSFSRSVELPPAVDQDNVEASFADGVLTINLRKRPEAKPRRIQIQESAGAGGQGATATQVRARTAESGRGEAAAGLRTITRDQLFAMISRGDRVQIINALEPQHYGLGFIRGSRRIPLSQMEKRIGEIDRGVPVVVYCANVNCDVSRKAADLLASRGYDVRAYEGGIEEWKTAGLPTD